MAKQHITNVRISGFSAAVPRNVHENHETGFFPNEEACQNFVENVGIERRRWLPEFMTSSDLCEQAAESLLSRLGWNKNEVDLLIFVSQTPDYLYPATSCIIQGRMGLPQSTMCLDISSGCSGWVLGLGTASPMVASGLVRKALLLAGDSNHCITSSKDRSHAPLFGHSGTATALEYREGAPPMIFDHQNDGTGYQAIIKRYGGARLPFCAEALEQRTDSDGIIRRGIDTEMDGTAVYVFGITRVPKAVKMILQEQELAVDDIDLFLFHQANMMMNEKIRKKCGIPEEKCPYSLRDFGNNSMGSIPLTIVTQLAHKVPGTSQRALACGFGVGLAWSTAILPFEDVVVAPLIEYGP